MTHDDVLFGYRLRPERLRATVREAMAMRVGARRVAEGFAATGAPAAAAQAFEESASQRSRGRSQPPAPV